MPFCQDRTLNINLSDNCRNVGRIKHFFRFSSRPSDLCRRLEHSPEDLTKQPVGGLGILGIFSASSAVFGQIRCFWGATCNREHSRLVQSYQVDTLHLQITLGKRRVDLRQNRRPSSHHLSCMGWRRSILSNAPPFFTWVYPAFSKNFLAMPLLRPDLQ